MTLVRVDSKTNEGVINVFRNQAGRKATPEAREISMSKWNCFCMSYDDDNKSNILA
jgi:hypothetical protein